MISLTQSAIEKIQDLLAEENTPGLVLRVFVQGGGCSGMQYGFTFDQGRGEDDFDVPASVPVVVDSMSMQYLQGATINYREDLMGSSFVIDNPQAQTTCGCGSSFSV
jgi:iron-sulfur cluster insertion protein